MSIFFLMCSERSGSNFTTRMLNGHPNICGPSVKHIINPIYRNLFRYGDLNHQENWDELIIDIHRQINAHFSVWKHQFSVSDLQSLSRPGDVRTLIQNIFLEEARENGKQHVFIKENHVYEFLPYLFSHFPESKFIFQTRDPRDMALSWKKNSDHKGGVVRAATQWVEDQKQSLKNYCLLSQLGKAHFVSYEDLTTNSESEVSKILEFLGIPYDSDILNFHEDKMTILNAKMQKAWANTAKGVLKGNTLKYRAELSEEEVLIIEKICFFEMRHLGYQPEHSQVEVENVSESAVERLNAREIAELAYTPSSGVVENMQAKARFYQR